MTDLASVHEITEVSFIIIHLNPTLTTSTLAHIYPTYCIEQGHLQPRCSHGRAKGDALCTLV